MRFPFLMMLVCSACGGPSEPGDGTRGAFELADILHTSSDALRVHVDRRDVPLRELALPSLLAGLPMDGLADIAVDLTVPTTPAGRHDYPRTAGSFAFACRKGCTLGDSHAILGVAGGLPFGHLAFDKVEVRGQVRAGHVELSRWQLESKDVMLDATLAIDLATNLDDSAISGCVRFKPAKGLDQRDPKTAAVIATTGAPMGADGVYSIKIQGTLGKRQLLGQVCS